LVVKDYDLEGVDYNEVFCRVIKQTSLRILLVLMASEVEDMEFEQLEVETTFLHGLQCVKLKVLR